MCSVLRSGQTTLCSLMRPVVSTFKDPSSAAVEWAFILVVHLPEKAGHCLAHLVLGNQTTSLLFTAW